PPADARAGALARQGLAAAALDLVEINEAFGAVVAHSQRALGLPEEIVNPHGGGIALGHPIGASGARLVVHAAHELRRRGSGTAAVALCGGGGQGEALLLPRCGREPPHGTSSAGRTRRFASVRACPSPSSR